jgi:hypothetical protein
MGVHLAPNHQGYGHKGHHVTARSPEKGQGSKSECAMDKWRRVITVQTKYKTTCARQWWLWYPLYGHMDMVV